MYYKTNVETVMIVKLHSGRHFFTMAALVLILCAVFTPTMQAKGHLYGYNVQEWKNPKYNIFIQFEVIPQTPSVVKNTVLNFIVKKLSTGKHLENFTETVTIIKYNSQNLSANDITHKFDSGQVRNGDFHHSYVFTSGGTYEVFLRVDTATFINVSKFVVFVSSPEFQLMSMFYLLLPFILVSGAFVGIGVVIWRYLYKKR